MAGLWTNDDEASDTDHLRHVRILSDACRRPSAVVRHLAVTARILARAAARTPAVHLDFQGHVIDTGRATPPPGLDLTDLTIPVFG